MRRAGGAGGSSRGQTLTLRNFAGGLDRRDGLFTENQNRFRELVNYRVSNAKRLTRRPPLKLVPGSFDNATTQGLFEIKGALYTIAKKGDTVNQTLSGVTVTALRFDNPDYCTAWQFIEGVVYNGVLCALIRHTFPGTVVASRIMLHVFDAKANKPTYVEDPACPTSWAPNFPLHVYRKGTTGAWQDYTPRIAVSGGRLWISRPDGNVSFSRTGLPRVWNSRPVADLATSGEWYYFLMPTGASLRTFVVSEDQATLAADHKWSAYVLEYLDATGTWQQFAEDAIAPTVDKHYQPAAVASRFASATYTNEIALAVYWTGAADTVIRFRMIAGEPPVKVVSGFDWSYPTVGGASGKFSVGNAGLAVNDFEAFSGDGATVTFNMSRLMYGLIVGAKVYVGGVLKTWNVDYHTFDNAGANNAGSFALPGRIVFVAAPALGAKNIVVVWPNNYRTLGTLSYEGNAQVFALDPATNFAYGVDLAIAANRTEYLAARFDDPGMQTPLGGSHGDSTGGTVMPWNGQQRYKRRITHIAVTDAATGALVSLNAYAYGFEAGSESSFFLDRTLLYDLELAGDGDAGFLPTAAQGGASASVTALAAIKDRLIVFYRAGTQIWYVPADVTQHALKDTGPIGTGQQTTPAPALLAGTVLCGLARGIRGVALGGLTFEQERDENIGEPLVDLGVPLQQAATYWPWLGEYVSACTIGGAFQFLVLDYSPESKITAWSTWTVAGVSSVDAYALRPLDDRLYLRTGASLYYFDASPVLGTVGAFRDSNDPPAPALAYESKARWMFNDFGAPGKTKNVFGMDLIQTGLATLSHRFIAHDETVETDPVPVTDSTIARGYIPCAVWGTGIAPVLRSTDDSGHEIQEVSMRFLVRMR